MLTECCYVHWIVLQYTSWLNCVAPLKADVKKKIGIICNMQFINLWLLRIIIMKLRVGFLLGAHYCSHSGFETIRCHLYVEFNKLKYKPQNIDKPKVIFQLICNNLLNETFDTKTSSVCSHICWTMLTLD